MAAIPPELSQLMSPGQGPAGPAPQPPGPAAAPMSTPQPPEGNQQAANVQVSMAMDALEQALMGFGSESPEGQSVLAALKSLSTKFGAQKQQTKNLVPAELGMLMSAFPQMGGGAKPPTAPPLA